MTEATTAARRSRYTDAEREQFKAERAALVAAIDTFEIDEDSAAQTVFDRLTDRYSGRNSMLIMLQCPATFGEVKAMSKWNEDGRKIRKGSKAIYILAPAGDRDRKGGDVVEIEQKASEVKPGEAPKKMRFVWVRVFDRSQTEPAPEGFTPRKGRRAAK